MQRIAVAILLFASLTAGVVGLTTTASAALTPREVAVMHSDTYVVVSVTRTDDPAVYLMTVEVGGADVVLPVDARSGVIIVTDEPATNDPAETDLAATGTNAEDGDDCKGFRWVDLGFRNQGQCMRFVNTEIDTRSLVAAFVVPINAHAGQPNLQNGATPVDHVDASTPAAEERFEDGDDCKRFQWIDLGFRNQGQCVRFLNTGVDTRPWQHPRDGEGNNAEGEEVETDTRDACRHGGWEDLGYRNQGQCIADN